MQFLLFSYHLIDFWVLNGAGSGLVYISEYQWLESCCIFVAIFICKNIYFCVSQVERMNRLVSQLASVTVQERAMIDKCGDLLASTAAMQVKHVHELEHVTLTHQNLDKILLSFKTWIALSDGNIIQARKIYASWTWSCYCWTWV